MSGSTSIRSCGEMLGILVEGRSLGDKICGRKHQESPPCFFSLWQYWSLSGKYLSPLLKISVGVLSHLGPTLLMRKLDPNRTLVSEVRVSSE